MRKDYIAEKEEKKRSTKQGMWILVLFIIIFILVIFRFAIRSGVNGNLLSSIPSNDDAYQIAKGYIEPTLKSTDYEFSDNDYQCSKISDSIYVIKSYCQAKSGNTQLGKVNFSITLKYNGGINSYGKNWSVLNLSEN